ncbi:MAG: hypothetical protein ACSI46_01215 [Gloeotrichia echinulata DVL01]|nr:hypothetical protein [Gloeotrichia echinulata DEX184]
MFGSTQVNCEPPTGTSSPEGDSRTPEEKQATRIVRLCRAISSEIYLMHIDMHMDQ